MLDKFFTRPPVIARLRSGLLGPYLTPLAESLYQLGYSRDSIRTYLCASDKFGRWLAQRGYSLADISAPLAAQYISDLGRTPTDRLPKPAQGLSQLIEFLHHQGVIVDPNVAAPTNEVEQWLVRYERYLEQVTGVTASTRQRYRAPVKRFLRAQFGSGPVRWEALTVSIL